MGGISSDIAPWEWAALPVAATHMAVNAGKIGYDYAAGSKPEVGKPPGQVDPADMAVRNARLMERRKQLGLQGRLSTFITTARPDQQLASAPAPSSQPTSTPSSGATLLGG